MSKSPNTNVQERFQGNLFPDPYIQLDLFRPDLSTKEGLLELLKRELVSGDHSHSTELRNFFSTEQKDFYTKITAFCHGEEAERSTNWRQRFLNSTVDEIEQLFDRLDTQEQAERMQD